MKEILAKLGRLIRRIFCLFKLTISCQLGLGVKEEEQNSDKERKEE